MALFGKKKSKASAPPAAATAPAPTVDNAFDFDAISRDLDSQNGASSFDALLSQPASASPDGATPVAPGPADLPEAGAFPVAAPSVPVQAQVHTVPVALDAVPSQTAHAVPQIAPVAQPSAPVVNEPLSPQPVEVAVPAAPVQAPVGRVRPAFKTRKALPLVPLLGGLGVLAVLGGGAMFLLNSQKEPLDAPPVVSPRPRLAQTSPVAPSGPSGRTPAQLAPPTGITPPGALRSGSPGIAPPVSATRPDPASLPKGTSQIAVGMATAPTTPRPGAGILGASRKTPSATAGLDVGLASRLKALWQAGADAKHRGNPQEARASWEEALRLRPGHPGFREALAKLPR